VCAGKIRLIVGLKLKYKLEVTENVEEFAVLCDCGNYMRRLCLWKREQKLRDVENRMPEGLREGMTENAAARCAVQIQGWDNA
jgi:hypothetical protein